MSTAAEKKPIVEVFALWKRESNKGSSYFSGKVVDGGANLTGFYNLDKKNIKEPDLRIYVRDDEGNLSHEPFCSLWCNATKTGKKVLSGKIEGRKVVGFIRANATEKQPYINVYWDGEDFPETETPKEEAPKETPKEAPKPSKASPKSSKASKAKEEEIPKNTTLPF